MAKFYKIKGYDRQSKSFLIYKGDDHLKRVDRRTVLRYRNHPDFKSAYKDYVRSRRASFFGGVKKAFSYFPVVSVPAFLSILAFALFLQFLKSPTVPFSAEQIFNALSDVPNFPGLTVDTSSFLSSVGASEGFINFMDSTVGILAFLVNIIVYIFNLIVWMAKVCIILFGGIGL